MWRISTNFDIACLRNDISKGLMPTLFLCVLAFPTFSVAQPLGATISALSGTVLVNEQEQEAENAVSVGDTIRTDIAANATVEFSDGSHVMLGEYAQLQLATLEETDSGARISKVTLQQGQLRVILSEGHQAPGSAFDIETPNALIGLTFSQPDVEVNYDPANEETIALARTVALSAKNLLTDEEIMVPVGSTVIITALGVQVTSGIAAGGITAGAVTESAGTVAMTGTAVGAAATGTATGIGTGAIVAIGAGAAAAAGGIAVLATQSDGGSSDESGTSNSDIGDGTDSNAGDGSADEAFTGAYRWDHTTDIGTEIISQTETLNLTHRDTSVSGTYTYTESNSCCTGSHTISVTGTVASAVLTLIFPAESNEVFCQGAGCREGIVSPRPEIVASCSLTNNGDVLRCAAPGATIEWIRQ